ncbi:hypothetical protein C8R45DRAFT_1070307 [Mycena sanguinolenta]|nr:hypothetical protein C8R45DRAFT_1070307 [Mycena sanguinolenta]
MSKGETTLIILGSRSVGVVFAQAARQVSKSSPSPTLHVIECYETSLAAIHGSLRQRLPEGSKIGAILFVRGDRHDERTLVALKTGQFLDLDNAQLLEKLVVVLPLPDHGRHRTAGLRTFRFDGKLESAASLLTVLLDDVESHPPLEAVIMTVGYSGHGKSQLLNVLLGEDLLPVGKDTVGSTTKAVHRVQCNALDINTACSYTIAFDDMPGFGDTTFNARLENELIMRRYKEQFFPGNAYPSVILLVVSWSSITLEGQNAPHQFTSPLGDTVNHLQRYGLLDVAPDRSNVIVVVTKSLSSWSDFDDYETAEEKEKHWCVEAARRWGIITSLQRRLFPRCKPWGIVFVENDSGQRSRDICLPNGEIGYHTLGAAMSRALKQSSGGKEDRDVGAAQQALQSIAPASSSLLVRLEQKILVAAMPSIDFKLILFGEKPADTVVSAYAEMECSEPIKQLARQYLGVTYNPVNGIFGLTPVLDGDLDSFHHRLISHPTKGLRRVRLALKSLRNALLRAFSRIFRRVEPVVGTEQHYANWPAFLASREDDSRVFAWQVVTAEASIHHHKQPQVSRDFRDVIAELPKWSESDEVSRKRYDHFFSTHGTHVVLRVALGGVVRVVVTDHRGLEGQSIKGHRKNSGPRHRPDVDVFQEGGSSVASELVLSAEQQFKQRPFHLSSYAWPSHALLSKWIEAITSDPVFCPDNDFTLYAPFHTLGGLDSERQKDLEAASRFYLRSVRPGESGVDSNRFKHQGHAEEMIPQLSY